MEKQKLYYNAQEVGEILGISKTSAYALIRGWNQELKRAGWLVIAGKVPIAFFEDKIYTRRKEKTE